MNEEKTKKPGAGFCQAAPWLQTGMLRWMWMDVLSVRL